jgi:signal transduction histidine kinase
MRGDQLLYERASPIRDGARVVGHLVQLRKVVASPAVLRQVSSLIGKDAALVVGNADGSLWSDLVKPISHPPPSNVTQTYDRDGRRWIGATAQVTTGPWVIGVEFPEDMVLAPAHVLRRRFIAIGALIVMVALLLAERLSRRLTGPLVRLTTAAEKIAQGDRATPSFVLRRSDEVGRLSRAFSAMADSIRDSHQTLEHEIGERTGELQTALTRLHETQDELVRKERLATLGQLSSSIAHELRNPLAVMTNALYYLDQVLAGAPPKVREHLGKVSAQVRLSESIITGLLDVTRTGNTRLDRVDVRRLIDEHLSRVSVPASIQVERDVPAHLPNVWVDPVQIGQVLVNLFTNAIQAMETTGGILTVSARSAGDRICVDVADTGPGIPPDHKHKIFEPLFTTKARGIGLGLSVSRSLVDANGGALSVSSSVGGALLTLELPVVAEGSSRANDSAHGTAVAGSGIEGA